MKKRFLIFVIYHTSVYAKYAASVEETVVSEKVVVEDAGAESQFEDQAELDNIKESQKDLSPVDMRKKRFSARVKGALAWARHEVKPEVLPETSLVVWSPGLSASMTVGSFLQNKDVFVGGVIFGGKSHGATDADWFFEPKGFFGGGVVTGVVVESTFLTTISLGVARHAWNIGPTRQSLCEDKKNMAFVQFGSESMLDKRFSIEVSYRYDKALSTAEKEDQFKYRSRASVHTFSIGLIVRL